MGDHAVVSDHDGWTLRWGDHDRVVAVPDRDTLKRRLAEASEDARSNYWMAELVSPSGASCAVGLGRTRSVLTFMESIDPPYWTSQGSPGDSGTIVFFYDGHWTEFSNASTLSTERAIEALEEFFLTGERPGAVHWVQS